MRRITDQDRYEIIKEQLRHPPKGESSLHVFVRHFWSEVDPHPFQDGRHIQAKCEVLPLVGSGEIPRLILNEPPGSCKTLLCEIFWPAWHWATVEAREGWLFASYDASNVHRDSGKFLNLLRSPKFRGVFPGFELPTTTPVGDFVNGHKGFRFSASTGENIIGKHFGIHVYDDLIKPQSILAGVAGEHQQALRKAATWVREASTRAQDPATLRRLLIGQRLHELDPSGVLLDEGDWEHLCLPEEYEPAATWIFGDLTARFEWRTKPGELLWPERRPRDVVERRKRDLHDHAAVAAQLQQNPSPADGGIFSLDTLARFNEWPDLSKAQIVGSLDLSFGGKTQAHSRVAWQLWARLGEIDYLIDAGADWLDYAQTKERVRGLLEGDDWSRAGAVLVENKANGPALLSDLSEEFPQLEAFEPGSRNKIERMQPHLDRVRKGRAMFPSKRMAPWVEDVLEEVCKVPNGSRDDHWDCMSQALTYLKNGIPNYSKALKGWRAIGGGWGA